MTYYLDEISDLVKTYGRKLYDEGFEDGVEQGKIDGYESAFEDGYDRGLDEHDSTCRKNVIRDLRELLHKYDINIPHELDRDLRWME